MLDSDASLAAAQGVLPSRFIIVGVPTSVNGSSSSGHCVESINDYLSHTCPTQTSVLFDGEVPMLSRLDGDMWASQLLTALTKRQFVQIIFDFAATDDYTGVERIEVVMFNCPEWGIRVNKVSLLEAESVLSFGTQVSETITTNDTSCSSLVRVRMALSQRVTLPVLILKFSLSGNSSGEWIHLAEVTFLPPSSTNLTISNEEAGAPEDESGIATAVAVSCVLVVLLLIACVLAVVAGCKRRQKSKTTHQNRTRGKSGHTHSHSPPETREDDYCDFPPAAAATKAASKEEVSSDELNASYYHHLQRDSAGKKEAVKQTSEQLEGYSAIQRVAVVRKYGEQGLEAAGEAAEYDEVAKEDAGIDTLTYTLIEKGGGRGVSPLIADMTDAPVADKLYEDVDDKVQVIFVPTSSPKSNKGDLVYAEVVAKESSSIEDGDKAKAKQQRLMYAQLQSEALDADEPDIQLYVQVLEDENTANNDHSVEVKAKMQAEKPYAQVERKDFHLLPTEPSSFPNHLYAKVDKKKKRVNAAIRT